MGIIRHVGRRQLIRVPGRPGPVALNTYLRGDWRRPAPRPPTPPSTQTFGFAQTILPSFPLHPRRGNPSASDITELDNFQADLLQYVKLFFSRGRLTTWKGMSRSQPSSITSIGFSAVENGRYGGWHSNFKWRSLFSAARLEVSVN